MLEPDLLDQLRPKLTTSARRHLIGEARCPERHLLAACIRTVHGVLVMWRGTPGGRAWYPEWLDEISSPATDLAALRAWCSPCRGKNYVLDLRDPANPRLVR
jgi:hypothetical protein